MSDQGKELDSNKLKLIKVQVIRIEQENLIRNKSDKEISDEIRKYIEKVAESKC